MKTMILLAASAAALFAEWSEVRGLAANQKVEISIRKAEGVRGTFVSASDNTMVVRDKSGERSIAKADIRRVGVADPSRRGKNAALYGAIGLAAGIGIGYAVCPYCANEGNGGKYVGPGAAAGAGIGVAAGLLPTPYRTIYKAK